MGVIVLHPAGMFGAPVCESAVGVVNQNTVAIHLAERKKPKIPVRPKWPPSPRARCTAGSVSFTKYSERSDRFTPFKHALKEYHFHTPSEHTLDGKLYDVEMQLVMAGKEHDLIIAVFIEASATLKEECLEDDLRDPVDIKGLEQQEQRLKCLRAKFFNGIVSSLLPFVPTGMTVPLTHEHWEVLEANQGEAVYKSEQRREYCSPIDNQTLCSKNNPDVPVVGILYSQFALKREEEYAAALLACPLCPPPEIGPQEPTLEAWEAETLRQWEGLRVVQPEAVPQQLESIEVPLFASTFAEYIEANQTKYATLDPFHYFFPPMFFFYYYLGSGTEPPCYPAEWMLHPVPVPVYDFSIVALKTLINNFPLNRLNAGSNARPHQLLNKPPPLDPLKDSWGGPPEKCIRIEWGPNAGECDKNLLPPVEERKFWQIGVKTGHGEPLQYLDSSPLWSSGKSESSDPLSFESSGSSSKSGESDSSGNSQRASNSMGSGSSGFFMAVWKWFVVVALCLCCKCGACYVGYNHAVDFALHENLEHLDPESHHEHLDEASSTLS
jgi:carbonic anhydrase